MGTSRDQFIKYPRTPHLFGSKGTEDDRHLGAHDSTAFISHPSLIVEEKLDGTNVGIHFSSQGRMVQQCRGHEITEGMHPQYDLFKQWTALTLPQRLQMLEGTGIHTVPVLHQGPLKAEALPKLIQNSAFEAVFDNPLTGQPDALMEGLYFRIEDDTRVLGRAKSVRPEFVEKIKLSQHWQHQKMVPNQLSNHANLWS